MKNFIPNEADRKSLVWESLKDLKHNIASNYSSVTSDDSMKFAYFSKCQEEEAFTQVASQEVNLPTPTTIQPFGSSAASSFRSNQTDPHSYSSLRNQTNPTFSSEFHEFRVSKPYTQTKQIQQSQVLTKPEEQSNATTSSIQFRQQNQSQQPEEQSIQLESNEEENEMRKVFRSKNERNSSSTQAIKPSDSSDQITTLTTEVSNLKAQIIKIRKENHQRNQEREKQFEAEKREEIDRLKKELLDLKQQYELDIASRDEDAQTMMILMQQNAQSTQDNSCEICISTKEEIRQLNEQLDQLKQQNLKFIEGQQETDQIKQELLDARLEIQRLLEMNQTSSENACNFEKQLFDSQTQSNLLQEANSQLRQMSDRNSQMVQRLLEVQQTNQTKIESLEFETQQQILSSKQEYEQQIRQISLELLQAKKSASDKEELINGLVRENRRAAEEKEKQYNFRIAQIEDSLKVQKARVSQLEAELAEKASRNTLNQQQLYPFQQQQQNNILDIPNRQSQMNTSNRSVQSISYITSTCESRAQNDDSISNNMIPAISAAPSTKVSQQDQVLKNLLAKINNFIDSKENDELIVLDTQQLQQAPSPASNGNSNNTSFSSSRVSVNSNNVNSSLNQHYNKKLRAMRESSSTQFCAARGRSTSVIESGTPVNQPTSSVSLSRFESQKPLLQHQPVFSSVSTTSNYFSHSSSNGHLRSASLCPPQSISARSNNDSFDSPMNRILLKYVPQSQLISSKNISTQNNMYNQFKTMKTSIVKSNPIDDKENVSPQFNRRNKEYSEKGRVDSVEIANRLQNIQVGNNKAQISSKWDLMDSLEIGSEVKEGFLGTIKDLHSKIMLTKK